MIGTKEHDDLLKQFEKDYSYMRLDRENKELWSRGYVYQNGVTNNLYKAYISGYMLGKVVERMMEG